MIAFQLLIQLFPQSICYLFYCNQNTTDMKGNDSYINHTLNISSCKKSCKFAKASRFQSPNHNSTDFNYNIRSKTTNRSCSFGIGPRPATTLTNSPNPNRYNICNFPNDKRGASIGESREKTTFRSMINEIERKATMPPPNAYNIEQQNHGKSFSLRIKLPDDSQRVIKQRVPGPGQYNPIQMNKKGLYYSSKIRNTRCISFGIAPKKQYFKRSQISLGPGSYDVFNSDSKFSEPKIQILRRNTARNFGTGGRSKVEDRSKDYMPGPGQYQAFSSFGKTFIPQIS